MVDSYGKHPPGYIADGKDGGFLAFIAFDKTTRPHPDSIANMTDAERADLLKTMLSSGRMYSLGGHIMEQHIDISWNELWTWTTVIRDVEILDNKLIYTSRPAPFSSDGKTSVLTLIWQKVN